MIKSGKVIDIDNIGLVGATIAESDSTGKYIMPITKVITTNSNGIFNGDFKTNTFYTVSFVGNKKFTFNTTNGVPTIIKLENDATTPEINITSTKTYYKYIPLALLLLLILLKKKV
jgi:hypothetical protein